MPQNSSQEPTSRSFVIALVRGTDRSINPNIHVFDGGRELEHLRKTHASTGRTRKLHRERTWIQTQDLLAVRQQLPAAQLGFWEEVP